MGYQSKTYSLSDEVIEVIEEARKNGVTPNQLFRRVLNLIVPLKAGDNSDIKHARRMNAARAEVREREIVPFEDI